MKRTRVKRVMVVGMMVAVAALRPGAVSLQTPTRGQATPASSASAPTFDSSRAWEHLRQMVAMGPRPAGSAALHQTRAYITHQLASYGLTVQEQPFTADTPSGKVDMVNLIVTLAGRRSDRILLTGHYDTKIVRTSAFVGASDGASSGAILIELARVLKDRPREFTYEFVWFDGEEAVCDGWDECGTPSSPDNTYGSRYYVQAAQKAKALTSVKALILFDMIGARDLKIRRETDFSAPWLMDLVWGAAKKLGHGDVFVDLDGPVGGDDHLPFVKAGVPSIDLIDLLDYPQWHNSQACCDDLSHVAAGSLQVVGDVTVAALPDIEKRLMR